LASASVVVITNSPALRVVRRDRAERLHVGAVAGLGHREAAHQLPGDQVREVRRVVPLGAELEDRATEQPELDADLDQHRQVARGERLERASEAPMSPPAAVLLGEAHPGLPGGGISTRPPDRSRNAARSRVSASSRIAAYSTGWSAPGSHLGVLASSSAVRAGTSTVGWT
jgi:hypothetical protein